MLGGCRATTVGLAIFMAACLATRGHTQGASPSPPAEVRAQEATGCPTPFSSSFWVRINVVPDGGSCKFDPPNPISDLIIPVGGGVIWTFCSTCPVDTKVVLEAPGETGPFNRFTPFIPPPDAGNKVTVPLPALTEQDAGGSNAQGPGDDWKYWITLFPAAGGQKMDEIDPRLEIDDEHPLTHGTKGNNIPAIVAAVLVGLLGGAFFMRWRLARRGRS